MSQFSGEVTAPGNTIILLSLETQLVRFWHLWSSSNSSISLLTQFLWFAIITRMQHKCVCLPPGTLSCLELPQGCCIDWLLEVDPVLLGHLQWAVLPVVCSDVSMIFLSIFINKTKILICHLLFSVIVCCDKRNEAQVCPCAPWHDVLFWMTSWPLYCLSEVDPVVLVHLKWAVLPVVHSHVAVVTSWIIFRNKVKFLISYVMLENVRQMYLYLCNL